jgi:hypothetical protein
MSLIAGIFLSFLFGSVIQNVQESTNPLLGVDSWVDAEHFQTFYLAANVVTNLWTYFFGLIIFGLMFWVYTYVQKRGG